VLRGRFGGEGLADTGRTKEINDETMPFAFDKVIEAQFLVVCLDEGLQEVFAVLGEDEVRESVGVPAHRGDFLDVELHCV